MRSIWGTLYRTPISAQRYLGRDSNGDPSFADAETAMCRVEYTRANVINAQGEQVVSEIRLFSEIEIPAGSLVTIKGLEWPVLSCSEAISVGGSIDHYEMRL